MMGGLKSREVAQGVEWKGAPGQDVRQGSIVGIVPPDLFFGGSGNKGQRVFALQSSGQYGLKAYLRNSRLICRVPNVRTIYALA